jgi:two-component system, chemotaxis family, response regulator PixH
MATVLVVDDTPSELQLMCHHLRQAGYLVISAQSADEGFTKAMQQKLDVIVTDIAMPGKSGFDLCRSLKAEPATQNVPIVICSSKNQSIDKLWAKRQGAAAYVTKPFEGQNLVASVQVVLGQG